MVRTFRTKKKRSQTPNMDRRRQHQIHYRWVKSIPKIPEKNKKKYERGEQCLHCRSYVPLEWPLGSDWGGCTNSRSEFDGNLVFEHFTCEKFCFAKP